jgi:hypothetical protein
VADQGAGKGVRDPAVEAAHDQWIDGVMTLLQEVAGYFEGTDSPWGFEAARLLQNGEFIQAVRRDPSVLQGVVEPSIEEAQ